MQFTQTLFQLQQTIKILTSHLSSVIIGQLLSDASAYKSSPTSNTRLEWSFGGKFYHYAVWLQTIFSPFCNVGVTSVKASATSKSTGVTTIHTSYRIKTVISSVFNIFHSIFYVFDPETKKYIKVVPIDIISLINEVVLAHLIIGDGNWHASHKRVRIYTNSFTQADCLRLAESITAIGINTSVLFDRVGKNGTDQYILCISGTDVNTLRSIVVPHMHPSILYRIGL